MRLQRGWGSKAFEHRREPLPPMSFLAAGFSEVRAAHPRTQPGLFYRLARGPREKEARGMLTKASQAPTSARAPSVATTARTSEG